MRQDRSNNILPLNWDVYYWRCYSGSITAYYPHYSTIELNLRAQNQNGRTARTRQEQQTCTTLTWGWAAQAEWPRSDLLCELFNISQIHCTKLLNRFSQPHNYDNISKRTIVNSHCKTSRQNKKQKSLFCVSGLSLTSVNRSDWQINYSSILYNCLSCAGWRGLELILADTVGMEGYTLDKTSSAQSWHI